METPDAENDEEVEEVIEANDLAEKDWETLNRAAFDADCSSEYQPEGEETLFFTRNGDVLPRTGIDIEESHLLRSREDLPEAVFKGYPRLEDL